MSDSPDTGQDTSPAEERVDRLVALAGLEAWLETPMLVLGFVWLGLLVLELTRGLTPLLTTLTTVIWIIFIFDFLLRFALAPEKGRYLRQNWLGVISLLVPALRVLRVARAVRVLRLARATRGVRLVRVVGSVNRGMRALGRTMARRGLGYVIALTTIVTLAGAAGMYTFESELPDGSGLRDYPNALWWTAMIMTTMGTEYWPRTPEGHALCLLLALYAFTVFGYVTASLASFFIGRDAEGEDAELAGRETLEALRLEIAGLRAEVRALRSDRDAGQA
ncbi:MAG: ion transporter [Gemmatimonadaceae bacterium]